MMGWLVLLRSLPEHPAEMKRSLTSGMYARHPKKPDTERTKLRAAGPGCAFQIAATARTGHAVSKMWMRTDGIHSSARSSLAEYLGMTPPFASSAIPAAAAAAAALPTRNLLLILSMLATLASLTLGRLQSARAPVGETG